VVREALIWWDCASGIRCRGWAVHPSDGQQLECPKLLTCGGCYEEKHCRCANILARCTSTFSVGSLRASMYDFDLGMATGPSCDFGGTALQVIVRVNWLSSTVTASSLSDPSWSVMDCVTNDGAVGEKIFWVPLMARLLQRAFVRQCLAGFRKLTKTSFDLEGLYFSKSSP